MRINLQVSVHTQTFFFYNRRTQKYCTRAAPKVMSPITHWPSMSETDVTVMATEVDPSCQHPIIFCYHMTDGSRGIV